jgi:pSer/pThr/pTyr-binding forkhead associated (FHA) protein
MKPNDPREGAERPHATVLESVEEIRALARSSATVRESVPPTVQGGPTGSTVPTEPFRPVDRPSMAVLTVLDDGDETGEQVRVRAATFVIGRVDGDLVIPHDPGISGRHAELSRRNEGGKFRWYLRDFQSTNGTFARASQVVLHHGQEVLIGRTRLRFEAGTPAGPEPAGGAGGSAVASTRKWQAPAPPGPATAARPVLVELTPEGEGRRFPVTEPESWIGRDPAGRVVLNDPTVDHRHARVFRDPKGRWVIANAGSVNGVWARVDEIALERGGQFQCGEQRFAIKVL